MPRRRRSLVLFAFALMLAASCGGKLVDDEPLARTTTGTREGDDRRPPPDEPPLVPIFTTEPDTAPADGAADSGCPCGAIEGHAAHLGADRDCHDPGARVLACASAGAAADAACAQEPSAEPSCLEVIGADGGVELFWAPSTWSDAALSASLGSIKSCADGGAAVLATATCP